MAASREARRENRSSCSRAWRLLCIAVYTARTCVLASAGVNAKAATSICRRTQVNFSRNLCTTPSRVVFFDRMTKLYYTYRSFIDRVSIQFEFTHICVSYTHMYKRTSERTKRKRTKKEEKEFRDLPHLISLSSILPARLQPGSGAVLFGYIFFSSRIGRHCRSRVRYKLAAFVEAKCKLSPRIYVDELYSVYAMIASAEENKNLDSRVITVYAYYSANLVPQISALLRAECSAFEMYLSSSSSSSPSGGEKNAHDDNDVPIVWFACDSQRSPRPRDPRYKRILYAPRPRSMILAKNAPASPHTSCYKYTLYSCSCLCTAVAIGAHEQQPQSEAQPGAYNK
ncbi:unnamed protein product [Trichogramma brassicae]|uniref:Uncharacterized protein n=1 Tax=Trichogramma brassicae TaxID=86971 RepID=A0A6H5ITA5_9HYME|nr:unnamed protein product [Trichogramma brassicae]